MDVRKSLFFTLVAVAVMLALPAIAQAAPPNEVALKTALLKRGVIPRYAAPELQELYYQSYLARKARGKTDDQANPIARRALEAAADAGDSGLRSDAAVADREPDANVLVLLVEFTGNEGGMQGPLHNQIPDPKVADPSDNTSYWVPDFSPEHYFDMLFNSDPGVMSFTNYFLEQSGGTYMPSGTVNPVWVQVPHSEWWYGADQEYGDDNLNGPVWRIVQDAVAAAGDSIDWASYDVDPKDGYVDHIQLIHAGAGQEAGGGAQGDSSIWSHSWFANLGHGGIDGQGGVPTSDPNVFVGPYTIQPEDGNVGVFVHEFTHDLGAPDLYDTIYSGEASTGFWTCMASGSWLSAAGEPLGVTPSSLDMWTKWFLGWADPATFEAGDKGTVELKQASALGTDGKAIKVDLPDYGYTTNLSAPHSGTKMWWSGMGDNLKNTLTKQFDLSADAPHLTFWTWYDIEYGYDWGYVDVQEDGSNVWTPVAGNLTTTVEGVPGITGASGSKWKQADYDLSAWAGKKVNIRFRYLTDGGLALRGWAVDDISVDGSPVDDFESGDPNGWVADPAADGWRITGNPVDRVAQRYYIAEWRQPIGFDVSMNNWYNFIGGNTAQFFAASPGMLLWYSDTQYIDNWVGVHPWHGRLLLVDAQPKLATVPYKNGPMTLKALPLRTRIQIFDAAFSTEVPAPISVTAFGVPTTITPKYAAPKFNDSQKWYDDSFAAYYKFNRWGQIMKNATASTKTPNVGLSITVKSGDADSASILVDYSDPK